MGTPIPFTNVALRMGRYQQPSRQLERGAAPRVQNPGRRYLKPVGTHRDCRRSLDGSDLGCAHCGGSCAQVSRKLVNVLGKALEQLRLR